MADIQEMMMEDIYITEQLQEIQESQENNFTNDE